MIFAKKLVLEDADIFAIIVKSKAITSIDDNLSIADQIDIKRRSLVSVSGVITNRVWIPSVNAVYEDET